MASDAHTRGAPAAQHLVDNLPDLTPLLRAAYVFELEAVEKRLYQFDAGVAMAHEDETLFSVSPQNDALARVLWRRRSELLGFLWPAIDPEVVRDAKAAEEGAGC